MKTIIQEMRPNCYRLHETMKEAKEEQHRTNQDIADETGIPVSNVAKFFSGSLSSPCVYNVAALCVCLGLSLDSLMGIQDATDGNGETERIAALETELHDLKKDLEYHKKDKANLEATLRSRKIIIVTLFGVCFLLTSTLCIGVIYDGSIQDRGFITSGNIAPISIMCITAVAISIAVTVAVIARSIFRKRDDNNG